MNLKKYKHLFAYVAGIAILFFLFIFFITASQIGFGVKEVCRNAGSKYKGDCVQALASYVEDEEVAFKDRNSAVWALGQLGDERALPVLEKYYRKEEIEKKCPRREMLCQYELYKAVKLLNGGLNISAFVWRNDTYFASGAPD